MSMANWFFFYSAALLLRLLRKAPPLTLSDAPPTASFPESLPSEEEPAAELFLLSPCVGKFCYYGCIV